MSVSKFLTAASTARPLHSPDGVTGTAKEANVTEYHDCHYKKRGAKPPD